MRPHVQEAVKPQGTREIPRGPGGDLRLQDLLQPRRGTSLRRREQLKGMKVAIK